MAAVLIGGTEDISGHAATLATCGAERVYVATDPALESYTTDGYSTVLSEAIVTYHPAIVLLGSTANGRDLAPRVAARLKLGLTGESAQIILGIGMGMGEPEHYPQVYQLAALLNAEEQASSNFLPF